MSSTKSAALLDPRVTREVHYVATPCWARARYLDHLVRALSAATWETPVRAGHSRVETTTALDQTCWSGAVFLGAHGRI